MKFLDKIEKNSDNKTELAVQSYAAGQGYYILPYWVMLKNEKFWDILQDSAIAYNAGQCWVMLGNAE